jgi:DMSO/TMAO reductase YedYZ molybdopterin-dependent catalytic subunit
MRPPPGPARPEFWRSPLRSTWLTTMLGSILLVGVGIVAVTGLVSHAAYEPDLGANALVPVDRDLQPFAIGWPTSPAWLYAATQGLHVTVGIVVVPLLLAKLWSVIPRLFTWPPVTGPVHALERLGILVLVGSTVFQFATGIANTQLYYPWRFDFLEAHFYGGWVFIAAVALHVAVKLPAMRRAYATRGEALAPPGDLRAPGEALAPPGDLRAPDPDAPTLSRRGLLGLVGAGAGALAVTTAGQSIGGPLRELALLAPRGTGVSFPVNKTARAARVTPAMVGPSWRLVVSGDRWRELSLDELARLPQHTYDLPIACVEGWSTTQRWTGVRLRDLAVLAGSEGAATMQAGSLQPRGAFRQATIRAGQIADERSLLALRVNGEPLPLDHGYPARVIVPALPGVHCTKWVRELRFS